MSYKNFMKDTFLIAISQLLDNASAFILLPVITKTLGPEDYGIWSIIIVTVSLLAPIALMGLSSGVIRFLSAQKDVSIIRDDFYSVLFFVIGMGAMLSFMMYLFSERIAEFVVMGSNGSLILKVGAGLILLSSLSQITILYFRIFRQTKKFSALQMFQGVGKLLMISLLLYLGYGLLGALAGMFLIQITVVIISMVLIVNEIGFSFPHFSRFGEYIHFSLPLSLNPTLRWISESSDRYLIAYFLNSTYVGLYSAPYAIGNLILMLVMPIQIALFPEISRFYDNGKINEVKLYLAYSLKFFLIIAIPSTFGLTALSKPLLLLLTSSQFVSGYSIIPIIAFSGLLMGIFQIYVNITLLFKKSHLNFFLFLVPGMINICLNIIFIPLFGITGAAIATLISYAVMLILCLKITKGLLMFSVDLVAYTKMVLASIPMYLVVSSRTPSTVLELISMIFLGAIVYFGTIYSLKTLNKKEIEYIKNSVLRARKL